MEFQQIMELADFAVKFAVVPLVGVLWKVHGRLSLIEGKLEVMLQKKD